MPKTIVICSDGTGNTAIKGRGTNVFKLFEATDLIGHRRYPHLDPQVALYDDGVGTENFRPLKIFAGMTGYGLSRNVKQLYKELVRIYDEGDRIFLFGFSRGAFTARTLAGFIAMCGILDVKNLTTAEALESAVKALYKVYRKSYRTELMKLFLGPPNPSVVKEFRASHCLAGEVPIQFVGVWDTVDAVGLPFHVSDFINLVFYRFKFRDHVLSPSVKRACHALAIDDQRHSFHPLLWREGPGDAARIEQVWFAGAHSNVGGGYPKQGMSLVALEWMLRKAEESGLRLLDSDTLLYCEHANVDDKLYDPRAGMGIFYRWKPRDIGEICRDNHVNPTLHLSVLERIAHGTDDYAPGNLPPHAAVVITPTGDPDKDAAADHRARAVQAVLASAHGGGASLLSRVKGDILMGRLAYYVYVATCVVFLAAASAPEDGTSVFNPWPHIKNAGVLISQIVSLQFGEVFTSLRHLASSSPWLLIGVAVGFMVSYLMDHAADRRLSAVFSEFWHKVQPDLRRGLKEARRTAKQSVPSRS